MKGFSGPKKRLEILYRSNNRIVVDDFGVAPERAKNSLQALSVVFPDYKIIAVFEPNSGSRTGSINELKQMYRKAFMSADSILIPELSNFDVNLATADMLVKILRELKYTVDKMNLSNISRYIANLDQDSKFLIVFFSSYRLTSEAEKVAKIFSVQHN
jgi:UDP-N-acetylmuramate-alanine ligase